MKVYSSLKHFHFPEKLQSLPREKPMTAPVHVRWKPTNKCNHRCRYCAYRLEGLQLGQNMREADETPLEKAREIANDFVEMGVKAVTFSGGGEPLVFPGILEVSEILCRGGVKIAMLTNGALLSGDKARFFAQNATWVRVSMDGWDDESYTRYRGVKGKEYSRILGNMESFTALGGDCALGVSLIVDAENAAHVKDALRRFKESGVRSVKVSACIISNDAAENNAYHRPHFDLVAGSIAWAQENLAGDSFEIVNAWHTLDGRFENASTWCPYAQIVPVVGADLAVYPCHDKAYNHEAVLGSLKSRSFKDFWFAGKEPFFSLNPSRDCRHHCTVSARNLALAEYLAVNNSHLAFI